LLSAASGDESPKLLDALRDVGGIAYLRLPGGLEYTIRYARRATRPGGHTDVVLVADRPVWMWWDDDRAESGGSDESDEARFSVIQLRIGAQGTGEGRLSSAATITSDPDTGIALADFEKQTVLLTDVQRDRT
jgi:hypothetical protein